jgi:hypothetical protein
MEAAFTKMRGLVEHLRGEGLSVERLDLGGGLGVPYFDQPTPPSPAAYAAMLAETIGGLIRPAGLRARPGDRRQRRRPAGQCAPRQQRPEGASASWCSTRR